MTWWERLQAWEERHQFGIDASLTAATGVVAVPLGVGVAVSGWGTSTGLAVVLGVALWAPLAWRRRNPVASAVTVYAAGLLHILLGAPTMMPADLAVLVALYSVTVHGPRWSHWTAIVSAVVGSFVQATALVLLTVWYGGRAELVALTISLAVFCCACAVATWAFGLMRRARRETIATLRDRALRLEVERDQQARIATSAERTRIAREMHDIVAHSLSVIIAQADGGRYAAAADPDAATRALGTVAETGRAALADMRRLLGVLREPDGAAPEGAPASAPAAPFTPQPGEHDLEQLVDQVRGSGVRASLVRMGTARPLPPGIGLTVYRICQEALTNVLKHAGPDPTVTVLVQWKASSLTLEVADDGRGASAGSDGLGQGLLGMRERATMVGGTLTVGPRPGGGFRVRTELPLPPGVAPQPQP
ncbi:sensor histidine kinase [Cellulomonas triticagri]|uniref:histidine kinase n=1 Tax=Cellulomonas triticagri TaxID=2483352 RepID=A0A3M2IZ02_9CELL|nr:sensor histidine kinase [Cellulomonas triticagri]RMI07102.1 sensor histidine kinase [Cellulomonas triticagri]